MSTCVVLASIFLCASTGTAGAMVRLGSEGSGWRVLRAGQTDDLEVAKRLDEKALEHYKEGRYDLAIAFTERALAIYERVLGSDHADVAQALNNFAGLYEDKGDYTKAEPMYERSLRIREKVLGPEHPDVATSLNNLALLYQTKGDKNKAVSFLARSNDVSEHNIATNIISGSERQKLLYLIAKSSQIYQAISLHIQFASYAPVARDLALTTILRRKGRALDSMTDTLSSLRSRFNSQDRDLLDQFTSVRTQLSTLVLRGPDKLDPSHYRASIQSLEDQMEKLEKDISTRSTEFRAQTLPVSIKSVQALIPPDSALVEFFAYFPFDAKSLNWGKPRYVAYVLSNQGEPAWADLGEAEIIHTAVLSLRQALRDPNRPDVKTLARSLDQIVMRPVRKLLGERRTLLLSPDGALNLIPFAALVDEQDRYLVEQYSFIYLSSGRDLLRLQARTPSRQPAMIVADPDFGQRTAATSQRNSDPTAGIDLSRMYFKPLPGTAAEARELKTILPAATVLTKAQATEAAVKQAISPAILHIATHGFFLEDVATAPPPALSRGLFQAGSRDLLHDQFGGADMAGLRVENPLLRSGLGLAGANLHKSGEDDGVLTALEVSALNLWGTRLVVLSACDTGVGEISTGEGVFGLRRALALAGSESQVMSLWPVSDEGTQEMMVEYYKQLQAGKGRAEGLREVQLSMLRSEKRKHPFYWASFIQSGEWANMDGKR